MMPCRTLEDIDELAQVMKAELGEDADVPIDWVFVFMSEDMKSLEATALELADDFECHIDDAATMHHPDGSVEAGPAACIAFLRAQPIDVQHFKAIHEQMASIAAKRGVSYEGFSPHIDDEGEPFDRWLEFGDAVTCLRDWVEEGCPAEEELAWTFLTMHSSVGKIEAAYQDITKLDVGKVMYSEEPNEVGCHELVTFVRGTHREDAFVELYERLRSITDTHQLDPPDVLFLDEDDLLDAGMAND